MKNLTEKQKLMLDFIEEFMDREGMAPTVYEIADHFKIKTSTVFAHLRALQRKNELTRSSKARSISLTRLRNVVKLAVTTWTVPILGRINAGMPAESLAFQDGQLQIPADPRYGAPEKLFALRIQGQSMRDAGVLEGDIVLVAHDARVKSGDLVVALIQGGEATVKSYYPLSRGRLELRPANPDYATQLYQADEVLIQGKVVALLRNY